MKFKYKLSLLLIVLVSITVLPVSYLIFQKLKESAVSQAKTNGLIYARMLSRSTLNVLLSTGANIPGSKVDVTEMISMLAPLKAQGLIKAESVLLSSNPQKNGIILGSIYTGQTPENTDQLSEKAVEELINRGSSETQCSGSACYEFIAFAGITQDKKNTMARIQLSKEVILGPLLQLEKTVYYITFVSLLIALVIGLIGSNLVTRPLDRLSEGIQHLETGDFSHQVPVKGGQEFATLAATFNSMSDHLSEMMQDLEQKNEELTRLNKVKDEFLANTSHELKTPLNGIIGLLEPIVGQQRYPDDQNNLELILKSARRLTHLVDDLLDLSAAEQNDVKVRLKAVRLAPLVNDIADLIGENFKQKNLNLNIDIPHDIIIKADLERFEQVLLNLLNNALKFTEQGSVSVTAEYNLKEVQVTIEDTGIGIEPEKIQTIFQPFQQADGSIARKYGGTGLGLSIVKKLLDLQNGSIAVQSTPAKGSKFTIMIPVSEEVPEKVVKKGSKVSLPLPEPVLQDAMKVPSDAPIIAQENAHHILVVDDDFINLQVILNNLKIHNFIIDTADNGDDALKKINKNTYSIVLLDVMMPVKDGFEVCREIRQKYSLYELPVLMLTAKSRYKDVLQGFEAGANDYLAKPIKQQELLARIKTQLLIKESAHAREQFNYLDRELSMAARVQQSILPSVFPQLEKASLDYFFMTADKVGGDLYDYALDDEGRLYMLVADVSGHGIPAALISSMLKVAVTLSVPYIWQPDKFFNSIDHVLNGKMLHHFITACLVVVDLDTGHFKYSSAGHPPLYHWSATDKTLNKLKSKGRLIGFPAELNVEVSEGSLEKGDRLFLYSDGIIEAMNPARDMYGEERFENLLKTNTTTALPSLKTNLKNDLAKWVSGTEELNIAEDDITFLAFEYSP